MASSLPLLQNGLAKPLFSNELLPPPPPQTISTLPVGCVVQVLNEPDTRRLATVWTTTFFFRLLSLSNDKNSIVHDVRGGVFFRPSVLSTGSEQPAVEHLLRRYWPFGLVTTQMVSTPRNITLN